MNEKKIDQIDRKLLLELQSDPTRSQRDLAEAVGLSQNACWRRLKRLEQSGVILGQSVTVDRAALGLGFVVYMMVRTRSHSAEWLAQFRRHVTSIAEVTDFCRIGGDYDYLLKIVTEDMASYDAVYQRLIERQELDTVTSYFVMEAIAENRPLPL